MLCLPFRRPARRTPTGVRSGFTLIEMLAVMGIIVLLLAVTVPAIRGLSANKLNNGGRLFSNLLTIARSEAIDQRVLMQVRIVTTTWTNSSGTDDPTMHYRKFSLWQHKPPPAAGAAPDPDPYTQATAWETLPEGIIFETHPQPTNDSDYNFASLNPMPDAYFLDPNKMAGLTKTGLTIAGGSMDASCIEFTPAGALNLCGTNQVSSLYFLLVPGVLANGGDALAYNPVHHPNWLMVQITPLTGRIQVIRP